MPTNDPAAPSVITSIVIATDFSPASDAAVAYSLGIARRNHAKVLLLHVVSDTFFTDETEQRAIDDAWREGHRRMTEHFISGRLDGIEAKLLVEKGSIVSVLERLVEERKADLLAVGTRGRSRIGKLFLGSTAESIFRNARCPVLTVGPRMSLEVSRPEGPARILFCTGFSKHSLQAGELAVRFAEVQRAEIILLHVGPEEEASNQEYMQSAMAKLQSVVPAGVKLDTPPKTMVQFGTASEKIVAAATELQVQLIVLGVRQPEAFVRRLLWATAYDVVSNAPCPVLTVRSSHAED
ncbi:MAG TPA: universal stress protein [Terriglobales bacterium]|nr:universal stress protein [Terriglobales bacterium]